MDVLNGCHRSTPNEQGTCQQNLPKLGDQHSMKNDPVAIIPWHEILTGQMSCVQKS
jgi:hypothetical protein